MRVAIWLVRALLFFVLFAFALNNQQPAKVHWFFGFEWQAPMVIIVLVALAGGAMLGVLATLPAWWRARRGASAAKLTPATPATVAAVPAEPAQPSVPAALYDGTVPVREGR